MLRFRATPGVQVERSHLGTRLIRVSGSVHTPSGGLRPLGASGVRSTVRLPDGARGIVLPVRRLFLPEHGSSVPRDTIPNKEQRISDPRTNDRIRVPEVRLVGPAGEQVGVVAIEVALRLAQEADLDLVEVAPNSRPPVVKIMDYGKFKYETAQKAKEARRNQANTVLKEVRFRLKIDDHDYETKRKRAEGFLKAGDKVKAMILFRGREQSRPDQGVRLLARFAEDIRDFGTVESNPTIDGRNMVMVIGPLKSKVDAKAEQNARRAASKTPASADAGTAPAAPAAPKEQ
ncbi:MAG: translation initiation factor [Microbacteriaceae bacterium]|nr:translation initiation factor [Microbacteriaceae bacterium]